MYQEIPVYEIADTYRLRYNNIGRNVYANQIAAQSIIGRINDRNSRDRSLGYRGPSRGPIEIKQGRLLFMKRDILFYMHDGAEIYRVIDTETNEVSSWFFDAQQAWDSPIGQVGPQRGKLQCGTLVMDR